MLVTIQVYYDRFVISLRNDSHMPTVSPCLESIVQNAVNQAGQPGRCQLFPEREAQYAGQIATLTARM